MAFPYIFQANFESGSNAEFDSEADTGSRLDFPHYTTLAAIPGMSAPYSGAYCMRIQCGDTNDHTLIEGDIDIATGATRYFRWQMFISNDFAATADDNFSIFELQQAAGTQVYVVGLTITAATDTLAFWVSETDTPETTGSINAPKGRWFTVEVIANVDTAATNGDITVNIDGGQHVSLATTVQNAAAVGRGALGTQATAATTTGTILIDDFVMDDAQLYPVRERWPHTIRLTKTAHAFVGPGWIESVTLLSSNGTVAVYDTDVANTNDEQSKLIELDQSKSLIGNDTPTYFERGCYVVLTGTNPVAEVKLVRVGRDRGMFGPIAYSSEGAIRNYAQKRADRPGNV